MKKEEFESIQKPEAENQPQESQENNKSLKEIGAERKAAVIKKAKGVWGKLKEKISDFTDYAFVSREMAGKGVEYVGQKAKEGAVYTGEKIKEGAEAAKEAGTSAAMKTAETGKQIGRAGVEGIKYAGRAGVKGAEMAVGAGILAGQTGIEAGKAAGRAVKEGSEKIKTGAENLMIQASERYEGFETKVKARGQEAYENLLGKTSAAKGKFLEFVNGKKLEKLNREESIHTEALEDLKRKVAQLNASLENIRNKKAQLLKTPEVKQAEEYEPVESTA